MHPAKRRRLTIDREIKLSGDFIRANLSDPSSTMKQVVIIVSLFPAIKMIDMMIRSVAIMIMPTVSDCVMIWSGHVAFASLLYN